MQLIRLSPRLATVARYVPKHSYLLDVGSDHAYLPIFLVQHHVIDHGIVSEVARGPYQNMVTDLKQQRLIKGLKPKLADGLAAIGRQNPVTAITISGMGGPLIKHILDRGKAKLSNRPRLILQPNVDSRVVRQWLTKHRYRISHEQMVADRHRIYEVMVADWTRQSVHYTRQQLTFGPKLLQSKGPVFNRKWRAEANHLQSIINQIKQSQNRRSITRIKILRKRIQLIKKVL